MRTLSLKDRRGGLRIQRSHHRASRPKAHRKALRKKKWPRPRYRPSTPSWRMGRSTRLRTDFATQPDVAALWARSRRRAGAPQKQRGVGYRATACGSQIPNGRHSPELLRACRERPRRRRAAEKRDERAAGAHSITSSARRRNDSGMASSSALAVVRLITRSNLLGCSTGMSPGFAPRRILSTKSAERRNSSTAFEP